MIEYHKERWSDMQYDKEFKLQVLELSDEIGVKAAAEQLGIKYYTLADWRGGADRILDSHGLRKELKKYVFTRKNQYGLKNVLSMWISD